MIKLKELDFYYARPNDENEYMVVVQGIAVDKNGKVLWIDDASFSDSIRVGEWAEKSLSQFPENWDWYKVSRDGDSYLLNNQPQRLVNKIHI